MTKAAPLIAVATGYLRNAGRRFKHRLPVFLLAAFTAFAALAASVSAQPGGIGGSGALPGGIGGTGLLPGGIGGTGIVAVGPIQRFGSVFVLGKEYHFTPQTRFRIDGRPATERQLSLGDMVTVIGRQEHGRWIALLVQANSALAGRIDRVDVAQRQIQVLGQTVRLTPATRLYSADAGTTVSLDRFHQGDWVRVSALGVDRDGLVASAVIGDASPGALARTLLLRGEIAAVSADRRSIRVGGHWLTLSAPLAPRFVPGMHILATGRYISGRPSLTMVEPDRNTPAVSGVRVAVYGLIRQTPEGTFCNGFRLAGDATIERKSGAPVARDWGLVEGTIAEPGVIQPTRFHPDINPMTYGLGTVVMHDKSSSPVTDHARESVGNPQEQSTESEAVHISKHIEDLVPETLTAPSDLPEHEIERPDAQPQIPEITQPEITHPEPSDLPDLSTPSVSSPPTPPSIPSTPSIPSVPSVPAIPSVPSPPNIPELPEMHD